MRFRKNFHLSHYGVQYTRIRILTQGPTSEIGTSATFFSDPFYFYVSVSHADRRDWRRCERE